jgi:hypothetical protein
MASFLVEGLPLLRTLRDKFPKKYDDIADAYYNDFIAGKTEAETNESSWSAISATLAALRPLADDDVLAEISAFYADEYAALGAKDPALCYQYASGGTTRGDFSADLPVDLVSRENDLNKRVIETAKRRQEVPASVASDIWKKLVEQIKLFAGGKIPSAKYADYCAVSLTTYQEISKLPQRDAAILMRQILSGK